LKGLQSAARTPSSRSPLIDLFTIKPEQNRERQGEEKRSLLNLDDLREGSLVAHMQQLALILHIKQLSKINRRYKYTHIKKKEKRRGGENRARLFLLSFRRYFTPHTGCWDYYFTYTHISGELFSSCRVSC